MLPTNIERLISRGGNVSVDASAYLPTNLERFAAFSSRQGTGLTIRNAQKLLPTNMERIAAFGKGTVTFIIE